MTPVDLFVVLLVVYQVKHFVADYPLQTPRMLQKVNSGWNFVYPLSLHCAVHAGFTLAICLVVRPSLWWLALVDFAVHFAMDRIKAGPRYLGRYRDVKTAAFWISVGFDQMIHHLTHIWICWYLAFHAG